MLETAFSVAGALAVGAAPSCHAPADGSEEDEELLELAQALLETCTMADKCADWKPAAATSAELEACAIARVTRAQWAGTECIAPIREYYDCVLEHWTDCDPWTREESNSACSAAEQEAYRECPNLSHLPL